MNYYHLPFEDDNQALIARYARSAEAEALGGGCYVALSHGHGPAYVVVYLPSSYQGDAFGSPVYTDHSLDTADSGEAEEEEEQAWQTEYLADDEEEGDDQ